MAPCGNGYVGNAVETCSESLDTSIFNRLFDVPIHQHLLLLSSMIEYTISWSMILSFRVT